MSEILQSWLITLREALDFAPPTLVALAILVAAALLALALHGTLIRIARRLLHDDHPYLRSLLEETRGITRLALLLLAVGLVLPALPLPYETIALLARAIVIGMIVLIGWTAAAAIGMAADLYLLRYRLDAADNLLARKHVTQVRILRRLANVLVLVVTASAVLMTFEPVRQYGVSLFASAGVAGLVVGLAARPVLSNLIAGVQLAVTQPVRIDDAITLENEFGRVEEITATYVVVRLWDRRRLIVPLCYFIEKPFHNWTREGSATVGAVMLYLDYAAPVHRIRAKAGELVQASELWDRELFAVQVTDAKEHTIEVRILASASSAPRAFDLRCELREKLIDFLQREHPLALPRSRQETVKADPAAPSVVPAATAATAETSARALPEQVELARMQHR